ncbi:hypothetical protein ABIE51_002605 [Lysobacter sp. OAE881]|uniref:hypothetical protein n=1 Tax=Lysobacter sp. OAE881 TaxID=2663813 RepID=UPI00178AAB0D
MTRLIKGAAVAVMCVISVLRFLFFASLWWEKAFATAVRTTISPGGCYRLVEYEPFWIMP